MPPPPAGRGLTLCLIMTLHGTNRVHTNDLTIPGPAKDVCQHVLANWVTSIKPAKAFKQVRYVTKT